jgi:hypothetical protein
MKIACSRILQLSVLLGLTLGIHAQTNGIPNGMYLAWQKINVLHGPLIADFIAYSKPNHTLCLLPISHSF